MLSWPMTSNAVEGMGDHTVSIAVAELQRAYRVHLPLSPNSTKPAPLVNALHGGGGTGDKMVKLTLGGFNKLSDRNGFIGVYPDGNKKHWKDGRSRDIDANEVIWNFFKKQSRN
jgi:polyhydroxybutyrate depolymerase